jgi:endogenous inhibitor of DNA gyrase (YacG/DUF329 family)
VESCSLDANCSSNITTNDSPTAGSTSRLVPSSGAQKTQANYCTICCTIPDTGGWLAGSLAISSAQRDDVKADRQWENLKILAKSAQVSAKNRRPPIEVFAQVPILRILGVCGEVAERLKAAVC